MSLGVDFSQWGGALKPETVECWKDSGVKFAVVQYSERMTQHLDVLTAAGGLDHGAVRRRLGRRLGLRRLH